MTDDLGPDERRVLRQKVRAATLEALHVLGGEGRRRVIEAHALEHGGFTAAELAAPAPPSARDGVEHLVQHLLRWELTNLKRDGLVENPAWSVWRLTTATVEAEPVPLAEEVSAERLAELEAMPYRQYLRSPEWRRTRAAALLRAGHRCALNAAHAGQLEVHHNSYDAPRGRERSIDLTVLCESCHELHHREDGRPGRRTPTAGDDAVQSSPPRTASVAPPGRSPAAPHEALPVKRPSLLRRLLGAA